MLLREYYRHAVLGWFQPRTMHWAKIVTEDGAWKWLKPHQGIRHRLVANPPVHLYQTVMRIRAENPPRGNMTSGHLLGGPLLLEADLIPKGAPFNLWRIADASDLIHDATEVVSDRLGWQLARVTFSGSRGLHLSFESKTTDEQPVELRPDTVSRELRSLAMERRQTARSIGHWCREWDWEVTSDVWRIARVPWSIHGSSALRAIPLRPPFHSRNIAQQLREASPFSLERLLRIRMKRHVPPFTFCDQEMYGPYPKGWVTKLPIAVAVHLVWQELAKPAESGPSCPSMWFESGWRIVFNRNARRYAALDGDSQ